LLYLGVEIVDFWLNISKEKSLSKGEEGLG